MKHTTPHYVMISVTCLGALLLYVGTGILYGIFLFQYHPLKPSMDMSVSELLRQTKTPRNTSLAALMTVYGLPASEKVKTLASKMISRDGTLLMGDAKVSDGILLYGESVNLSIEAFMNIFQYSVEAKMKAAAKLPVVSTMFEEWPFLSACITGLGSTLMFMGLACVAVMSIDTDSKFYLRDVLLVLCALDVCSIWISITSASDKYLSSMDSGWTHVVATGLFVVLSLGTLFVMYLILKHFLLKLQDDSDAKTLLLMGDKTKVAYDGQWLHIYSSVQWVKYFFVLACLSGLLVLIASVTEKAMPNDVVVHNMLLFTELITLELCGAASAAAVYSYTLMQPFYYKHIE